MKKIEITAEIRNNMDITLNTLRQIVDKSGNFEFNDLRATGLTSVEVRQAISFLNSVDDQSIKQNKTTLFGGCTMYQWCWNNIYWNRLKAAHEASQQQ